MSGRLFSYNQQQQHSKLQPLLYKYMMIIIIAQFVFKLSAFRFNTHMKTHATA